MAIPRRSQAFYRAVLALPLCVLGYLWFSGRVQAYWNGVFPFAANRAVPPTDTADFVTGLLWMAALSPLIFASWEIGKEHTAARRLDYGIFVGFREVVRRALGRDTPDQIAEREATFQLPPKDNPGKALLLGVLVAIAVPVFFSSVLQDLRTGPRLVWLAGAGILMGAGVYCRYRATPYLRDEPGQWDVFRQWRLLNPSRYDAPGRVFIRWQIVATLLLPFWWLGVGAAVLFGS